MHEFNLLCFDNNHPFFNAECAMDVIKKIYSGENDLISLNKWFKYN